MMAAALGGFHLRALGGIKMTKWLPLRIKITFLFLFSVIGKGRNHYLVVFLKEPTICVFVLSGTATASQMISLWI